jgi:hypothetical protein
MAYGDGGFFFLQPVNNGYGGIEVAPSYGRSSAPMQHPAFSFRPPLMPAHSAVNSTGNGNANANNGANNGSSAEMLLHMQVDKLKTALAKTVTILKLVHAQEAQSFALLASMPSADGLRGNQLKALAKIRGEAIDLVGKIRSMEMELSLLTGNKITPHPYPQFKEFPAHMGEELITDVVDDEMMLPDQEDPLPSTPSMAAPGFFAENEQMLMLAAGAVGAYALLRMMK